MTYIDRPVYMDKIKNFIDKPIIKVLVGMRRVGKSTILKMISDKLLKDKDESNKIFINFESLEMINIRDSDSMAEYIRDKLEGLKGKIYFFFDEVQIVNNWERVVNGLHAQYDCDIYLTGSNSSMLSGDLSTLLAGRYVSFEIFPFSFVEFIECYKELDLTIEAYFQKYILLGGMPAIKYFNLEEEESFKYLSDIYNTVLVKDILEYKQIRDVDLFNRILLYIIENVGHTFSALSIRNYLKCEGRNISVDTILNYLSFCHDAFLINKASRYDAIGKRLLKVEEKYYLTDHGFRQAKGFSNINSIERILENIVYISLLSKGYQVTIGKVKDCEIDFIAERNGKKEYYQVSYLLNDEKTRDREFGVYEHIKDNFEKYVLSMDNFDFSISGIVHKNIVDWLLEL